MSDNQSQVIKQLLVTTKVTLGGQESKATVTQQNDMCVSVDCFMDDNQANVDAVIEALQTYKKERVNNG